MAKTKVSAEEAALRLKALAHPARLKLLAACRKKQRPVQELASVTGLKSAVASRHLGELAAAGFVTFDRGDGKHPKQAKLYRPADGFAEGIDLAGVTLRLT